jgi:hypothetical protein
MTFPLMRPAITILMIPVFLAAPARGQSPDETAPAEFLFLPGRVLFTPLAANEQEPRVGVRKEIGSSRMKLDIGSVIDLFGWVFPGGELRAGADFFTYALTTSADRLRLQVDAVDGYFGGHVSYSAGTPPGAYALRLRILHQSGHLIDGHWDYSAGFWRDGKVPVPYTRDFAELTGSLTWTGGDAALTVYSGFSYAWLARPDDVAHVATLHGAEIRTTGGSGTMLGRPVVFYAADHMTVSGIPRYHVTMNVEAGAKFGPWDGTGIKLYLSYRSGLELFSQYFSSRRSFWGVGFALDFW